MRPRLHRPLCLTLICFLGGAQHGWTAKNQPVNAGENARPAAPATVAKADGPVELQAPEFFGPFKKEGILVDVYYHGQKAKGGIIDLTATNGFYNSFGGREPQPGLATDAGLIPTSFKYLRKNSVTEEAAEEAARRNEADPPAAPKTDSQAAAPDAHDHEENTFRGARWHLYCPQAGEINLSFYIKVDAQEAKYSWPVAVGTGAGPVNEMPRETKPLHLVASDGETPQPQTLSFQVKTPGRVSIILDVASLPPEASASIAYIRAQGSAIDHAHLLRARWRPAAVHTAFTAPAECPQPTMWVFESKDLSKNGGYSPLTTPFGYYGTSFDKGYVPAGSAFNFSMWAAGRGATVAPPVEKMPRLIATSLPAEFGTFGGEGTGVKLRGAAAYHQAAASTIQAMRVTVNDGVTTYYGYFYDEPAHRWRLFCSGQAAPKREGAQGPVALLNRTGSFLEVPGPPGRQMSGDIPRTTARRGWFYGSDGQFYPVVHGQETSPNATPPPTKSGGEALTFGPKDQPANQMVYNMANYATDGWIAMTMGGMEYYTRNTPPVAKGTQAVTPEYLQPDKVAGLFKLPVEFGESKASHVSDRDAVIDYPIKEVGPHARAILYYGTKDCITYEGKNSAELSKGTPTQQAMVSQDRIWQAHTPEQPVAAGLNQFKLTGLAAKSTYYYRLYVEHDEGKSWDYVSGSFQTH